MSVAALSEHLSKFAGASSLQEVLVIFIFVNLWGHVDMPLNFLPDKG